jgi:hypothetical protein
LSSGEYSRALEHPGVAGNDSSKPFGPRDGARPHGRKLIGTTRDTVTVRNENSDEGKREKTESGDEGVLASANLRLVQAGDVDDDRPSEI